MIDLGSWLIKWGGGFYDDSVFLLQVDLRVEQARGESTSSLPHRRLSRPSGTSCTMGTGRTIGRGRTTGTSRP